MEGNRHEKVAIVISAYIIGFTTAFIGFGVNQLQKGSVEEVAFIPQIVKTEKEVPVLENVITSLSFGEDGLYATTPAGNLLLSASKASQSASLIGATETPGFHFAIVDAEVSKDGNFAYFCEQLSKESETCDPYLYSLTEDVLYRVTLDGENYVPKVAEHTFSWTEAGILSLNSHTSQDVAKPWVLGTTIVEEVEAEVTEEAPAETPVAEMTEEDPIAPQEDLQVQ